MRKLLLLALLGTAFLAAPARAGAYNHLNVCESTLRGGYYSDDDIHRVGVQTGATSFGGWGSYWHGSDGSVYVYGRFNYGGGVYHWYLGHCWGGDYGPDTIG
jgi:hypothetical protein